MPMETPLGANLTDMQRAVYPIQNYRPEYLRNWRKARANVRAGLARAKVAVIGMSTEMGYGAGTGSPALDGARDKSWPARMAQILTSAGLPARRRNICGSNLANAATDTQVKAYHGGTIIVEADWEIRGAISLGNDWWGCVSPNTGNLVYTPGEVWDRCDVYSATAAAAGLLRLTATGGSDVDFNLDAAGSYTKTTVSAPSALITNALTCRRVSGGTVSMSVVDPYNSTAPDVAVLNMGWSGSVASDWSTSAQPWYPPNALPVVAPNLTFISLGINNWTDTPVATVAAFKTSVQTLITAAKQTGSIGDVVLVIPFPSSTTRASVAQQKQFIDAIYQLARLNGCVVMDFTKLFTSYAISNPLGLYNNELHPNELGYWDAGNLAANLLLR